MTSEVQTATRNGQRSVTTLPEQCNGATPWRGTERRCKRCGSAFLPARESQEFCPGGACRAAYHKARYLREPHRCPLCGRKHEPC